MPLRGRSLLAGLLIVFVVGGLAAKLLLAEPTRVLLVGDSILRQTGPALDDSFGRGVAIDNQAVNNSGLLTPGYVDWPRRLERLIAETEPDVIVVLFIGNYTDSDFWVDDEGNPVAKNTPAFFAAWAREADHMMEVLRASDADVYWVLPPPEYTEDNQVTTAGVRQVYADLATRWPEIRLIDANNALAGPDGSYLGTVEDRSGDPVPLRVPDTVHLTDAGARRLARTIRAAIAQDL